MKTTFRKLMKYTAFKLTVSLLISTIAIVTLLSLLSYRQSLRILSDESSEASLQTIIQTSRHIDYILQGYQEFANTMAHDQDLLNKLLLFNNMDDPTGYEQTVGQLTGLLTSYSNSNKTARSITLFSADQSKVVSTLSMQSLQPMIRKDNAEAIKATEWNQVIQASPDETIFLDTRKNGFVSSNAPDPMFAVARVIKNPFNSKKILGTILIEISTGNLEKALSGFKLGNRGGFVIVGGQGKVVFSSNVGLIDTPYSGTIPPGARPSSDGSYTGNYYAQDEQGVMQNYTFRRSPLSGWHLLGYYPKEELVAPMKQVVWASILVALACSIAAAFSIGFLVQRNVGSPLRKLRLLMQEGERGNLNVRTNFQAENEIGDLGRAFNRMMDQISLAYYDTLTNLPNRRLLVDRMETAFEQARRSDKKLALLFIDLDRFKMVNDSLGHHAGDLLIQNVGQRLQHCIREGDTVARIAGDEFVILLPEVADKTCPLPIAERVLDKLRTPFTILDHEVRISGSVGIAYFPDDGTDAEALIKCADMAMYEAKAKGKNNFKTYDPLMSVRSNERIVIENDLHRALSGGELELYYQPRIDPTTGTIQSSEALLRWNHPRLGMIPPDKFIAIAEETGLIVPLGEWVLKEACRQNKAWQDAGYAPMRVAVNVSAKQFGHGLAEQVALALKQSGLQAKWLEIEITESVLTDNEKTIIATLRNLKAMGLHIAIDDFGTGYSNLAFLMKFQVDTLKIDRSFIRSIHSNVEHQLITGAIISLAHNLGMRVVTEGVETADEHRFLLDSNPDEMQGFYYAKPAPPQTYEDECLKKGKLASAGG